MVTYAKKEYVSAGRYLCDIRCMSTDEKPTEGIANGSDLIEMDTSKVFFFDEDGKTWEEWGSE